MDRVLDKDPILAALPDLQSKSLACAANSGVDAVLTDDVALVTHRTDPTRRMYIVHALPKGWCVMYLPHASDVEAHRGGCRALAHEAGCGTGHQDGVRGAASTETPGAVVN